MEEYECKLCNYKTKYSSNYSKHLLTNKHKKNEDKIGVKVVNVLEKEQKTDKKRTLVEKKGQKTDTKRTFSSKKVINVCKYCDKEFSSRQTLLRHEKKYCKQKEDLTSKFKKLIPPSVLVLFSHCQSHYQHNPSSGSNINGMARRYCT